MHLNALIIMERKIILKIKRFVDGDGLIAEDFYSKKEFEIRLYGIDAPEMNYCSKIKKDEKKLNIPAALLIKLGYKSFEFFKSNMQIGEICTLVQEENNLFDKYGRTLGYLILRNGNVMNEIMIREGYAKPYSKVFCKKLPMYKEWSLKAKTDKKGLFAIVDSF